MTDPSKFSSGNPPAERVMEELMVDAEVFLVSVGPGVPHALVLTDANGGQVAYPWCSIISLRPFVTGHGNPGLEMVQADGRVLVLVGNARYFAMQWGNCLIAQPWPWHVVK